MKGGRDHGLDALLIDIVSYNMFKKGKEPLSNIDPRRRVKKGIWMDDGIDLNLPFKKFFLSPHSLNKRYMN